LIPSSWSTFSKSFPAGPTKGFSLQILVVTGLLANEPHVRAPSTLSEDGLGGVLPQIARLAIGCCDAELRKIRASGYQFRRRFALFHRSSFSAACAAKYSRMP
jgi:hypothetical protein